jgi:DNA repair ATPase RecN
VTFKHDQPWPAQTLLFFVLSSANRNIEKASLLSLSEDSFERMCSETESLLKKLTELNNRMSDYCDKLQNPSAIYTVQRHREILNDYTNEFRKTRTDISSQLEREQLLSSVKKKE